MATILSPLFIDVNNEAVNHDVTTILNDNNNYSISLFLITKQGKNFCLNFAKASDD